MALVVEHEDVEALKAWGMGLDLVMESCIFCFTPTRYWHLPTNSVVCPCCAVYKDESDVIAAKEARKAARSKTGSGFKTAQ